MTTEFVCAKVKKSSANQANRPKTAEDGAKAFANLDLTTVSSRNSATC